MKYRATLLSAVILPGLGQLVYAKTLYGKLKGLIFTLLTLLPLFLFLLSMFQSVLSLIPPTPLLPKTFDEIVKLSWEIKEQIYQEQSKNIVLVLGIIIPIWILSIFDGWILDRKRVTFGPGV